MSQKKIDLDGLTQAFNDKQIKLDLEQLEIWKSQVVIYELRMTNALYQQDAVEALRWKSKMEAVQQKRKERREAKKKIHCAVCGAECDNSRWAVQNNFQGFVCIKHYTKRNQVDESGSQSCQCAVCGVECGNKLYASKAFTNGVEGFVCKKHWDEFQEGKKSEENIS